MTIEHEISAGSATAEKKLWRLLERERKQQQGVDSRTLTMLLRQRADLADGFEVEARAQLDTEPVQRSAKARAPRPPQS